MSQGGLGLNEAMGRPWRWFFFVRIISLKIKLGVTSASTSLLDRIEALECRLRELEEKLFLSTASPENKLDTCAGRFPQNDTRLSVCIAIPCVPRHVGYLKELFFDIRHQTLLPYQVVVSLSETSVEAGAELQAELAATFFADDDENDDDDAPSDTAAGYLLHNARSGEHGTEVMRRGGRPRVRRRRWPTLEVVTTEDKRSHADNRNVAAARCKADIVSWFDADDRMHSRRTEVLEAGFRLLGVDMLLHGFHKVGPSAPVATGPEEGSSSQGGDGLGVRVDAMGFPTAAEEEQCELNGEKVAEAEGSEEFDGDDDCGDKVGRRRREGGVRLWSNIKTAQAWDPVQWSLFRGHEVYDAYNVSKDGLEDYKPPDLAPWIKIHNGHVSVRRAEVLGDSGLGLVWDDNLPEGGKMMRGEDVRFVKTVLYGLGRRPDAAAVVLANLTFYRPSWAPEKRCVLGRYLLFDCVVTVDVATGQRKLDFGHHISMEECPGGGRLLGRFEDEADWSLGMPCVDPTRTDLEALAPGVIDLNGEFKVIGDGS